MIRIFDNEKGILDQNDRTSPTMIIMHYTESSLKQTINYFSANVKVNGILAHYVISENGENEHDKSPMRFATDQTKASHAGFSYWNGQEFVNVCSVGIENVNKGSTYTDEGEGVQLTGSNQYYYHFKEEQIIALIKLCQQLISKYDIRAFNITGHGDIAVPNGRKVDPGPLFPWRRLADYGIGLWYNININYPNQTQDKINVDKTIFISKLVEYGYPSPNLSTSETDGRKLIVINNLNEINTHKNNLIEVYNMHYRQEKGISSEIDEQDMKIIDSLIYLKQLCLSNKNNLVSWKDLYASIDKDYLLNNNLI